MNHKTLKNLLEFKTTSAEAKQITKLSKKLKSTYPDGYTVVLTWGKTRTLYSLLRFAEAKDSEDKMPEGFDPGEIEDMNDYAQRILALYGKHLLLLRDLGVSDIIITALHYEAWISRGEKYKKEMIKYLPVMISEYMVKYYKQGFTPYFIGLDQLFHFYPEDSMEYKVAVQLRKFEENWEKKDGDVQLGIELFPVNSYTKTMYMDQLIKSGKWDDFLREMHEATNPYELEDFFYDWEIRQLCGGRYLPRDGVMLGCSYNGDFHVRSHLASEFIHHKRFSMMFYPAPSLLMPVPSYLEIFKSLTTQKAKMRSAKFDHSGNSASEFWAYELNRSINIASKPTSPLGLLRSEDN